MINRTSLAVALAICAGLAVAGPSHGQARTFTFTAIPDQDESQLRKRFGAVADYLSSSLGVKVRYVPVKSYAAAITAFRNNQVQLAWFGGLSGVRARTLVPGSRALAQGAEDAAFVTYFIAHAGTGLTEQTQLSTAIAGKTFTFGSKGSTSGRLMPEFHIRQAFGKRPGLVFRRVGFSGDHSRTIALVQSGTYAIGAVNFKVWQREMKAGRIDPKRVRIIWRTPPYPDYQWTVRGDVDKRFGSGFGNKIKTSLLAMNDPKLLKVFPRTAFIAARNADYEPIEKMARAIGLID